MTRKTSFYLFCLVIASLATWITADPIDQSSEDPSLKVVYPADNTHSPARKALGERLFHDARLSVDNTVSCAACHLPEFAFADDRPLSRGFEGRTGLRNSPPLFNLAFKDHFFWDGRVQTLREQVLVPIQDHREMAANLDYVITRLNRDKSLRQEVSKAYGDYKLTKKNLALALENYLLSIVSFDSPYDQSLTGKKVLTEIETKGKDLFFSPVSLGGAGCFTCHSGPTFTDHQFRNNGLKPGPNGDRGRFAITRKPKDRDRFVTPSLRNIALTAPYMHDGRFDSLEEVLAHYHRKPHPSPTLAPELPKQGLQLSQSDQQALISFLKTLTDPQFIDE